ncbi:DUF3991 and TOPRIM domain-containing protein [Mesorhizobium sp. BH1-1-4]|uniref:DUF3991 and TOPRIM domain-containing protein n=1 Tax=Mesorhizobium sp. BH1-1-4 TaxID=2876662 RepID=UPI001CD0C0B2|nr:DUF3991 and TOPRIM domain-containing protein [Mesorhizobium sp. BH1-1-4]MBZ9994079.1 DUF3991 and toprim domain-containing protein [Mesorhizobium sp. BH1-1-4]
MDKRDIETVREQVSCAAVLERGGWKVDTKQSTRRAVKYRRGDGEIVIVIHEGKGWFDPLSEAKGDVFSLVIHLDGVGFADALVHVRGLVGFVSSEPEWVRSSRRKSPGPIGTRWMRRPPPRPGSPTWLYLSEMRCIPDAVLVEANCQNLLREGPYGSMWAAHMDAFGVVIGWEQRGVDWRGFAVGGAKELFRLGTEHPKRLCVTEAAIDAMSLAAIEGPRRDTLYVSTGGGWAPAADAAIRSFAIQPGLLLVAATDANAQGDAYGERIRLIAKATGSQYARLRPNTEDWNKDLTG